MKKHHLATLAIHLVIFGLCGVLLVWNLWGGSLLNSDDPIYASIAREAHQSGEYLDLKYQGHLLFEKPPLFFWLVSASYSIFGVNDFAARLPDALASLALLVLVYLLAVQRRTQSEVDEGPRPPVFVGGLCAVGLLLASSQYFLNSRRVMTDLPFWLTVFSFLALLGNERGKKQIALGALFLGLAVMLKGPAVVVPVGAAGVWLLLSGRLRRWRAWDWAALLVPPTLVAGWWHLLQFFRYGTEFVGTYLGYHAVERLTSSLVTETKPWFYLERLFDFEGPVLGILLLVGLVLAVLLAVRRRDSVDSLLALFAVLYLALILVMKTRLEHYVLPLLVIGAIYVGRGVQIVADRFRGHWKQWALPIFLAALCLFSFMQNNRYHLGTSEYSHNTRILSTLVRGHPGKLVAFNLYAPAAGWYADKPMQTWSTERKLCGHLQSIDMLQRSAFVWCPPREPLRNRLHDERPILLTRRSSWPELKELLGPHLLRRYTIRLEEQLLCLVPE